MVLTLIIGSFLAVIACWHGLAAPRLRRGPSGDARVELLRFVVDRYTRLFHQLKVEGLENLPETPPKGMLLVSNHGSPLDPFLIQASLPHLFIHWMMAKDQMGSDARGFWEMLGIIPTDRIKGDPAAALAAIRLLRRGKTVGLFPEGRLETAPDTLLPFQPGGGTLISLSGAPVLMVCVDGTPRT
ncbi:MAG: 1-acyl-sn-glycerol-3-phosphate acyltransferase, partial [Phycisphaerales bacterium]|nr:1-acyl-sn-glycerol-3-phosphate acyltransferase [Phycisphaerales bacterium]